jgi:hypothetical protein
MVVCCFELFFPSPNQLGNMVGTYLQYPPENGIFYVHHKIGRTIGDYYYHVPSQK